MNKQKSMISMVIQWCTVLPKGHAKTNITQENNSVTSSYLISNIRLFFFFIDSVLFFVYHCTQANSRCTRLILFLHRVKTSHNQHTIINKMSSPLFTLALWKISVVVKWSNNISTQLSISNNFYCISYQHLFLLDWKLWRFCSLFPQQKSVAR